MPMKKDPALMTLEEAQAESLAEMAKRRRSVRSLFRPYVALSKSSDGLSEPRSAAE